MEVGRREDPVYAGFELELAESGALRGPIDHIISGLRSRAGGGLVEVNTRNRVLIKTNVRSQRHLMRPVEFGEAVRSGTRLTLFSADKPDRFFRVIRFWMDETSGVALALKTGVPSYQVADEEGRIHLVLHLPIEEENEDRWCLWRLDQAGFDSRSVFDGALVEE